jgi:hypothetical protein
MSTLQGFTQQQRDRLVSRTFSTYEKRNHVTDERIQAFIETQAVPYTLIPEVIGFQIISAHEAIPQDLQPYSDFKGIYQAPLLYDPVQDHYISLAQSGPEFNIDPANAKKRKEDWIVDYHIHVWRLKTLQAQFLGNPISESLKAATIARERYCPGHQKAILKPFFVLLLRRACDDDAFQFRTCAVTPIPTVTVTEADIM